MKCRSHTLNLFILLFLNQLTYAKSSIEASGDILALLIPSVAFASSVYLDDRDGEKQFYKSFTATTASTLFLKYTTKEQRPDKSGRDSFPSAHTALAFAGAGYIHKRYGIKYAPLPYIAAVFTGYSRIHAKKHHTVDVYAGALIAIISNWYFVSPYKKIEITPEISENYTKITFTYRW